MTASQPIGGRRVTRWRAIVVWLMAASSALVIVLTQVVNPTDWITLLIVAEVVVSFGIIGAVLVTRLPGNRVGWLLWSSGVILGWAAAGTAYATNSAISCGGCQPLTVPIAMIANASFAPVVGIVGIFIPLLFPSGRAPSPRWRPVAWFGIVATVLFTAAVATAPGVLPAGMENPIGVDALGAYSFVTVLPAACLFAAMVLALASVISRFRHADAVERQQLRWFGYAGLLMIVGLLVGLSGSFDATWVVLFAGLGLMPLAIGVAVMRYRLYDLDRLTRERSPTRWFPARWPWPTSS